MNARHRYSVAIAAIFIWIGFVGAISFMEAWLKFQAPGITLSLGLGIGRIVFSALNTVELVLAGLIIANFVLDRTDRNVKTWFIFLLPLTILALQSFWLLPALDARAELHIEGSHVPPSNLHVYYVTMEFIKTGALLIVGINLLKKINMCMNISKETMVGEIVAVNYQTAAVFKKHGIDFCCRGARTIEEVCQKGDIDEQSLLVSLNHVMQHKNAADPDFLAWDEDLLADYIEKKHHRYVRQAIPEIQEYFKKIATVHGDKHPELKEIEQLFQDASVELMAHLMKEENIIFPYVRRMKAATYGDGILEQTPFGSIQHPIRVMMHEHDTEGERFRKISNLSQNYTLPLDACATYKVAFELLKEFEADLHQHIHLESNILFPKAIQSESELNHA